ncbi:MAG: amidohydrolase family protein [Betaproteobacteria bacterium]|nr:amidohydrolase family protein [Betaproteobacteria bacterium]
MHCADAVTCTPGLVGGILLVAALAAVHAAEDSWMFDAHSHSARGLDLERVIARMDAAGVGKIVLFARRQGTDEEVLGLHAKHPGRVVPAVGFQNPGWLQQSARFVDEVEGKLASGRFRWMGELLLRHYGVPELRAPDYDIPPDSELLGKVLALSARYGVPLTIHHEAEPGDIEAFRRALRQAPQALVVWAHWCGRATPEDARRFLGEFANLHCDLGASHPGRRYGREKNPLVDEAERLQPAWRALIMAFPDRFLAAVDAVDPAHYDHYEAWVKGLRRVIAQLPPEVRGKLAFENAERLLGKWKGGSPGAK